MGLAFRAVIAYFDSLYRSPKFWELAAGFWNKIGSAAIGFLVLLVMIRCFSYDTEIGIFSIINSTTHGRFSLFRDRLISGGTAIVLSALLLYAGNIGISFLLGKQFLIPTGFLRSFSYDTAATIVGSVGFFLTSAMICDLTKNHPIAMCLCGLPFASNYFINVGVLKAFNVFWFLRYGFFTELMRGRTIKSFPLFWLVWYAMLIGLTFFLAIWKRKERKEL